MNEGGAARRQLRSYVFGAAGLAAIVSLAACSGGTSIGGDSGGGSGVGASSSASPYGFTTAKQDQRSGRIAPFCQ